MHLFFFFSNYAVKNISKIGTAVAVALQETLQKDAKNYLVA